MKQKEFRNIRRKDSKRSFISHEAIFSSVAEFSWDLKYPDAQVLLARST
jgi:endoglucanase